MKRKTKTRVSNVQTWKKYLFIFFAGFILASLIGGAAILYYGRRAGNALQQLSEIEQSKQSIDRKLEETRASLESSIGRVGELERNNSEARETNSRLNDRLKQLEQIFSTSSESNTDIADANRSTKEILDRITQRGAN